MNTSLKKLLVLFFAMTVWAGVAVAQEAAVITLSPEVDAVDEALLGRKYEVVVNVKGANLVDNIKVTM